MATVEYRYDPHGISEIANSPDMHAMLRERAELGAAWIRAHAPVDSGDFRDHIQVVDAGRGGPRHDRAAVRIEATSTHAVYVEHGSRDHPGYRLLARSVDIIERG